MNATVARLALAAAVFFGFLARAATFQAPLFDAHSWRQADTATIARNFVRERFDPFAPEIDARGTQREGNVETGLELLAVLVALVAKVTGFSTHLGRLIPAVSFPIAAVLLFRFARDRYGEPVGLATVWIYALGLPLTVFIDRAFMNESLLVLLTIVCLRSAQQYLAGRMISLVVLFAASTLVGIIKPPYLVLWGAVAGLFVERHGAKACLRWEIWGGIVLNAVAVLLYFQHAHAVIAETGLTFGLSNKLFNATTLFSPTYWSILLSRLIRDLLSPVVLLAAGYGLVNAVANRHWAELGGLAGFVVHLVVVTQGNLDHNYYQLMVIPIATMLAGLGVVRAVARIGDARRWPAETRLTASASIIGLCVLSMFIRSASFHSWYELNESRMRVCHDLGPKTRADDLVAFIGDLSPDILFCLDRRGWLLAEDTPVDRLRFLVKDGADVIVAPRRHSGLLAAFSGVPQESLLDSPDFIAFRLIH